MKTPKEHAATYGATCPVCGSYNIRAGAFWSDDPVVWQPVECIKCGSTWIDQYKLAGYIKLKEGTK